MHEVLSRRPSSSALRHPLVLLALVVALTVALTVPVRAGWSNSATATDDAAQQWNSTAPADATRVG